MSPAKGCLQRRNWYTKYINIASKDPLDEDAAAELNGMIESPSYAIAFVDLAALEGE